jgi:hypothetical protein
MTDRCPFAESCWMGGGSYACVKTPPFCREPLIPKDTRLPPYIPEPSPVFRIESAEHEPQAQSVIKQGELF